MQASPAGPTEFATSFSRFLQEPICEEHFRAAREGDMIAVEISAGYKNHTNGSPEQVKEIRRMAADQGLRIDSVHASVAVLDASQQRRIDECVLAELDIAAECGARLYNLHNAVFADPDRMIVKEGHAYPSFTVDRDADTWPPMRDRIHEKLERYVAWGKDRGVAVTLETEWQSSYRLIEFVGPFDPRWCGICFDTGHAQIDSDAAELADILGPRIIATHLHDNDGTTDQHKPPFTGSVDWPGVISALRKHNYAGPWTFEVMTAPPAELGPAKQRIVELWNEA